jgi:hypothetical protein
MWLITTSIAAFVTTGLWYKFPKYRLEVPALMFWGSAIMILIDHILGYEGGDFIEMTTDGLVPNSLLLGIYMIIPVLITWLVVLLIKKPRKD